LNEYSARGLRLIEVDKADLVDLPDIVDVVWPAGKFIVFCDDLSLKKGEPGQGAQINFDGSVAAATPNADLRHQ
jgi:predicted AAA+ superfamily ATPase